MLIPYIWGVIVLAIYPPFTSRETEQMATCHACRSMCLQKNNLCARCRNVFYCTIRCQKNDWILHKPVCRQGPKKIKDPRLAEITEMCNKIRTSPSTVLWHPYVKRLTARIKKVNYGRTPLGYAGLMSIQTMMIEDQPPEIIVLPAYIAIARLLRTVINDQDRAFHQRHSATIALADAAMTACRVELKRGLTCAARLFINAENDGYAGIAFFAESTVWGWGTPWLVDNCVTAVSMDIPIVDDYRAIMARLYIIVLHKNTTKFIREL